MNQEIVQYVVYPVAVLAVGGVGALVTTSIVKYFNKLNATLVELNKSIQLIILDQTKIHAEQDKSMALFQEEIHTVKIIQREHAKYIDELYDITDKHNLSIELLKESKEDK